MNNHKMISLYEGVIETWKAQLALYRIQAMKFPKSDWPDLMQELVILIMGFNYDPANSKGASERTALFAVINRHLLFVMRGRKRDEENFERYLESLGVKPDGSYEGPLQYQEPESFLYLDVQQTVQGLSEFDKRVAKELADGSRRIDIAEKFECDWKVINKSVQRIKAHFEEHGLDAESL